MSENSVCAKIAQVRDEGGSSVNREIEIYNPDVISLVGNQVNSMLS